MRKIPNQTRQAGVATVPLLVIALGMVLIAILLGTALATAKSMANSFKSQQHEYMVDVQMKLGSWYRRNLAMEADASFTRDSDQLFSEIGVEKKYGVELVLSGQLDDGTVRYHKVAVVAPGSSTVPSGTGFGGYSAAGVYTAPDGFKVVEFDGKLAQHKASADTNAKLARIAEILEQYVSVRISEDANSDSINNYFRPARDCSHVSSRELPCTNGDQAVELFFQSEALAGMAVGVPIQDGWGGQVVLNNDPGDVDTPAPFTMTISAVTPWGQTLFVKAVQPTY